MQRGRAFDAHQSGLGLGLGAGGADDADHFVDVGVRQQQTFDGVLALPGLGQQELRPAADHERPMADELRDQLLDRQRARLAVDQRQRNQRDRVLQWRELIELVEHHLGIGVALDFQDQANRLFQIAFVADGRDAGDLVLVDQFGDALLDAVARLLVGDLGDDDTGAPLVVLLDAGPCPDHDRAAAGVISLANAGPTANDAAGGKVRTGDDLHQLIDRHVRLVDDLDRRGAHLAQVVRRDRGGHADRDAVRAVDQQVRKLRRQHRGLGAALVVGGNIVDGVELQILEHQGRDRGHPRFGIPHGRRWQAGDRAEVPLLVDQHVAHVPLLGHAHQGGIDHAFAVRMIVTAGVARDLGALHAAGARRETQVVHGDQDAPLRGLQPVAHVGQGAADDHAHGVRQVTILELVLDRQIDQATSIDVFCGKPFFGGAGLFLSVVGILGIVGQNLGPFGNRAAGKIACETPFLWALLVSARIMRCPFRPRATVFGLPLVALAHSPRGPE